MKYKELNLIAVVETATDQNLTIKSWENTQENRHKAYNFWVEYRKYNPACKICKISGRWEL